MSSNALRFARMHTVQSGQLAHMGLAEAARKQAEEDALTEAYLAATAPKALAYADGRMIWDRPPVKVTKVCMRERRFRYARVSFMYEV
jgi:hypothetical protein